MEFTAWEGSLERHWTGPNEYREIVEIGALRVNLENPDQPEQAFDTLVKPVKNPQLSDYFIKLTGISQQRLDREGKSFKTAMAAFAAFAAGVTRYYAYGEDGDIIAENFDFQNLENPLDGAQIINARPAIRQAHNLGKNVTSGDLPTAIGAAQKSGDLQAHKALDDARALAQVLVPLLRTPGFTL